LKRPSGVIRVPVDSIKPAPSLVASKVRYEYLSGVVVFSEEEGDSSKKSSKQEEPGQAKSEKPAKKSVNQSKGQPELILLLDIPKFLSEKELLEFGTAVQQTVKETSAQAKEPVKQQTASLADQTEKPEKQ